MKLSHTQNKEWGSKARKEQEALRGLTHTDAKASINEALEQMSEEAEVEARENALQDAEDQEWRERFDAEEMDRLLEDLFDVYAGTAYDEGGW